MHLLLTSESAAATRRGGYLIYTIGALVANLSGYLGMSAGSVSIGALKRALLHRSQAKTKQQMHMSFKTQTITFAVPRGPQPLKGHYIG